ncbi:MAG TPA: LuxR family transcriptional regulator [Stellaceae bacterium]|nr:LuxR family transcriptional regulator [Stellaceae bacterium]
MATSGERTIAGFRRQLAAGTNGQAMRKTAGRVGPTSHLTAYADLNLSPGWFMHRLFQAFIDGLADSVTAQDLHRVLGQASAALDLSCFAYLSLPASRHQRPTLISNYPVTWTDHYLRRHYERVDPAISKVLATPEPFEWGPELAPRRLPEPQRLLLDEAAQFGIRCGFTVPIHDRRGPVAAVTFAADERHQRFERCIEEHGRVLQLMAMHFHAYAHRRLCSDHVVDGVALSPREFECLEWAARGKSAWDIGQILSITRRTAAFHLDNAKAKLGVRSICQAVARFAAAKRPPD